MLCGGSPLRACRIYICTVRLLTLILSFRNSSRMRAAPHNRFATFISLTNAIVSGSSRGSRPFVLVLRRQYRRKPCLCHFSSVSGSTTYKASCQPFSLLANITNTRRSCWVNGGFPLFCSFNTITYCLKYAFSATDSGLLRMRSDPIPAIWRSVVGFVQVFTL